MNQGTSMTDERLLTGRPTLAINEALTMAKCKNVADLFYKAEIGELTIYVIADGWKVGRIHEIDHSIIIDETKPLVSYRNPDLSNLPLADAVNFDPVVDAWIREECLLKRSKDMIVGNTINYGSLSEFKLIFKDLTDEVPIAAKTFKEYRISHEKAEITVDLNRILKVSDRVHERFLYPEPAVLLQDAWLNGKLVVRAADIKRLLGQSPDENLSELFAHPDWPPELGIAIAAWQNARDSYKEGGDTPSKIIKEWLKVNRPALSKEAVDRIVIIANWDKTKGRKKKTAPE
jgi:hypothetical protein